MSHCTLGNKEWLLVGNSLYSQDGSVELKMQVDGKIAVYKGGACIWQNTASQISNIKGIYLEENGNLNIYDKNGAVSWSSGTGGSGNSTTVAVIQNDGNFVLYNGSSIWATDTGN